MVILVACEGSPTREGLLTIRIRTFVWSFSRVDSTMPCQGTGVAERLGVQRQYVRIEIHTPWNQRLPCRNVRTCGAFRRYERVRVQSARTSG